MNARKKTRCRFTRAKEVFGTIKNSANTEVILREIDKEFQGLPEVEFVK
jgi:hypothetical protein